MRIAPSVLIVAIGIFMLLHSVNMMHVVHVDAKRTSALIAADAYLDAWRVNALGSCMIVGIAAIQCVVMKRSGGSQGRGILWMRHRQDCPPKSRQLEEGAGAGIPP